jgi:hypothetical protein
MRSPLPFAGRGVLCSHQAHGELDRAKPVNGYGISTWLIGVFKDKNDT